jgi:hypothetical protein
VGIEDVKEAVQAGCPGDSHPTQPAGLFHQQRPGAAAPGGDGRGDACHAAAHQNHIVCCVTSLINSWCNHLVFSFAGLLSTRSAFPSRAFNELYVL